MQNNQARDLWEAAKLVAVGVVLSAVVFAVPDVGYSEHKSIFAVTLQSPWGRPFFDWPSAWCAVKIILMAVAGLAFVNAVLRLVVDTKFEGAALPMFMSAILPLLLGSFGVYELIKAIL